MALAAHPEPAEQRELEGPMAVMLEFTGQYFGIHSSSTVPVSEPTDVSGWGGLINMKPGAATIFAYVGDGCIVGEARAFVEVERLSYVFLVPNGLGR